MHTAILTGFSATQRKWLNQSADLASSTSGSLRRIFVGLSSGLILFGIGLATNLTAQPQQNSPDAGDGDFFERKVRPILIERCYECHSASAKRIEGNLRLDHITLLEQGGDSGTSLDRDNLDQSLILQAVRYDGYEMPPTGKLPQSEIDILTQWVKQGAYWPKEDIPVGDKTLEVFDLQERKHSHWAWNPIRTPAIPNPPALSSGSHAIPSGGNPIDAFIADKLIALGLRPAPVASRHVLINRLHWDLLGLPPSIDTIERWTSDPNLDWYSRYVDELLSDPQFGVRFARHWLDLVRYAQSRGHEFDEDTPGAEHYRDYVLRAWNSGLPYDQFLAEHIAGDLLEPARRHPTLNWNESILGTGFWHLGEWVHSPVDVRKDETDRFDNMVDVFSKSFLGLTVSCARCHDHKFDAISTEDYYALFGVLRSSHYRMFRFETDHTEATIAEQWKTLNESQQRLLKSQLATAWQQAKAITETANITVATPQCLPMSDPRVKFDSRSLASHDFRTNGQTFGDATKKAGEIGLLIRNPADPGFSFRVSGSPSVTADPFWAHQKSRVETTNASNRNNQVNIAHKTFLTPTFTLETDYLSFLVRGSFRVFAAVDSHRLVNGPLHGETIFDSKTTNAKEFRWVTSHNLGRYQGKRLHLEFSPLDDQNFELFQIIGGAPTNELAPKPTNVSLSDVQRFLLSEDATAELSENPFAIGLAAESWLDKNIATTDSSLNSGLKTLASEWHEKLLELRKQVPVESMVAMAMQDGSGQNDFLLIRGNADRPGEEVQRRFLEALGGKKDPLDDSTGSGRLKLVEQMLSDENPLVARVFANRIWQHLLGRGIVATPDDFGVQGRLPTHPELLDFLSDQLRQHQWSPKFLIKLICESHVYKQSVAPGPFPTEDANNDLLSFANLRKLEGEAVRDGLLYVAGQLDMRLDGRTSRVYLTDFMTGRGRPGVNGTLHGEGKRSLFLEVRRNFLNPMLTAFDMPTPFSAMGKRNASNVPGQALTMINDPLLHWIARKWVERELADPRSDEEHITRMLMTVTGRRPSSDQLHMCSEYLAEERNLPGSPDPKERNLEIWSSFAHALLNSKTMLFRF